jgi:hypothetical protein
MRRLEFCKTKLNKCKENYMKKTFKVFGIIALMLIIGFVMIGCDNPSGGGKDKDNDTPINNGDNPPNNDTPIDNGDNPPPDPVMYTVWFDSNGGSPVGEIPVESGNSITMPENPSNDNIYIYFAGWFTADNTPFTAETTVSANIIVYAQWEDYTIGDTGPSGGLILYDKGSVSNGWRILEAAPVETEFSLIQWGAHGADVSGTETAIGRGKENTEIIVAFLKTLNENNKAAQKCDDLIFGGKDDWFLPSYSELNLMYKNLYLAGLGGFSSSDSYWSSSQGIGDKVSASRQDFSNGNRSGQIKYISQKVRAIRQF